MSGNWSSHKNFKKSALFFTKVEEPVKCKIKSCKLHMFGTILILLVIWIFILVYLNWTVNYGDNLLRYNLDNEDVCYENDSTLNVNHIKDNKDDGFYVQQKEYKFDI